MSIKPETRFSRNVNKHVSYYHMKNNNPYLGGIPDFWYSGSTELWVEYKYVPVAKPTAPVVPELSALQFRWIKNRIEEGRNVWVIVGIKTGGVVFTKIEDMKQGISADRFLTLLLTPKELAGVINEYLS